MLNLHELEQRWLRYKIKSYLPYIAITLSVSVILFSLFVFLREPSTIIAKKNTPIKIPVLKHKTQVEKKTVVTVVPKVVIPKKEHPMIHKEIMPSHSSTNKVLISPSLGFMKKMQTDQQPYYKNENSNENQDIQVEAPTVTVVHQNMQDVQHHKVEVAKKISITHKSTHDDIAEIISRFKKNNNPALSLFVAKKYYELGEYRQAYNYALITNQINQDIEVSWIIFTKSLVKLGQKKKAIQTLKQYIQQSHSNSAQILLDDIISGKFK